MSDSILSRRWPWITAALLAVLAYAATLVDLRIGRLDARPRGSVEDIERLAERQDVNVLFILIDTLRAERLGSYGYERETDPLLRHLSDNGVRFAHHLAQSSWTKCSMASLWTGLYPARAGVTRFNHLLPPDARLPAEIFRDAGFRTAGVFRNGWVEGYHGFDQGFEVYMKPMGKAAPASVRRENPTLQEVGTDYDAVDAAKEFLRVHGHERWFLYLHLMDVHEYLYDEASAAFGSDHPDVYDNSILRTNLVLNEMLLHLAERGHLEDTLIVVGSDHGEAFGERGFEGHARRVYRETTEVPFVISFPFRLEPGLTIQAPSANVDVWPTVLDLLGLPAMEGTDGRSRKPEILAAARGETPPASAEPLYAHLDQTWGQRGVRPTPTVAVTRNGFRYVTSTGPLGRVVEELFEPSSDPAEQQNLLEEKPELAAELRSVSQDYLRGEPPWGSETEELELNEMQLNQLRALGYQLP